MLLSGSGMAPLSPPNADAIDIVIPETAAGERLDRAIANLRPDLSRSRAKALIAEGKLRAAETDATISEPALRVKPGQHFRLYLDPPVAAIPKAQAIALDIVFEDADLIVIDKPAGLVVHPAPGNPDRTLVNALIAHCGASLSGIGGVARPGIVHRLDKDTSGLIVAAKNDFTHRALSELFAAHDIARAYRAIVWGLPQPMTGEIAGAIGRDPHDRKRMAIRDQGGKPALTFYRVEQAFGLGAALLQCRLATGRTHQIRVHLAAIHHPVIGDPVYGRVSPARRARLDPDAAAFACAFPRQALHAAELGFRHPRSGRDCLWQAPLPADMQTLADRLKVSQGPSRVAP